MDDKTLKKANEIAQMIRENKSALNGRKSMVEVLVILN